MGILEPKQTNMPKKAADELDKIIEGLTQMFEEKYGRKPTEDEVKIWISQIKEASVVPEEK